MNRSQLDGDLNYGVRRFEFTVSASSVDALVMKAQKIIASQLPHGSYVVENLAQPATPEHWSVSNGDIDIATWEQTYNVLAYVPRLSGEMPRETYMINKEN